MLRLRALECTVLTIPHTCMYETYKAIYKLSKLKYPDGRTNGRTGGRTDICASWAAFAAENIFKQITYKYKIFISYTACFILFEDSSATEWKIKKNIFGTPVITQSIRSERKGGYMLKCSNSDNVATLLVNNFKWNCIWVILILWFYSIFNKWSAKKLQQKR